VDFAGGGLLVDATLAAFLEFEVLHRVRDIDIGTGNFRLFESSIEDRSGGANEWLASKVLLIAGLFADHDHTRSLRPLAQHRLRGVLIQFTSFAMLDGRGELPKTGMKRYERFGAGMHGACHIAFNVAICTPL